MLHFTFEIFNSVSSSQLQVVCQYLKFFFLPALVLALRFQLLGITLLFCKGHKVCLVRIVIYVHVLITEFVWHFEQDCQRSSLYCTFSSPMCDTCNMHHHGKGLNIFAGLLFWWYSFRTSGHEFCAVRVFRFHIVGKYSGGSAEVWTKVDWTLWWLSSILCHDVFDLTKCSHVSSNYSLHTQMWGGLYFIGSYIQVMYRQFLQFKDKGGFAPAF